jgi:hypothetical protein
MARITHYDQGDAWVPQATFKVGGTNTDPTTITVKVKEPDGTISTMGPVSGATGGSGITRVSAGVYTVTIDLDDAGYWFAQFIGTGTAAGSEEHQAIVDPSEFFENAQLNSRALVGLAETKDWLQQQNIETSNDLETVRVINDMSQRFIDEAGGREFKAVGTNPQTRFFEPASRYEVAVGDMATAPSLVRVLHSDWATVVDTVDPGDYLALPMSREAWEPITRLRFNSYRVASLRGGYRVEVTGTFGFPAVPGNVRQAVLEAVAAALDRDVEHYRTDLGAQTVGEGTTVVTDVGRPYFLTMPPSALAVARMYAAPLAA